MISPLLNSNQQENYTKNNDLDLIGHFNIKKWRITSNKEVDSLSEAIDYFDMRKESVAIFFENSLEGI
jgi:hypothetical protein